MADILFRGIKIPESCIECDFTCERWGQYYCIFQTEEQNETALTLPELYKNCPLRLGALPEGHGRLGDLDKLEENLRLMAAYQTGEQQQGILGCCETIRMTKPIVPAEGGNVDGNP